MKVYRFSVYPDVQEFVAVVAGIMGYNPTKDYQRCCYSFGEAFSITQNGDIEFADTIGDPSIERLIDKISERGYYGVRVETSSPAQDQQNQGGNVKRDSVFTIGIDIGEFSTEAIANLQKLIKAKGNLMAKALLLDNAEIDVNNSGVYFPWISDWMSVEERHYTEQFVRKLCAFCISRKRINSVPKEIQNEKFEMRTFCNRLGMIGAEYEGARKMLLRNLDGNAAWKHGHP